MSETSVGKKIFDELSYKKTNVYEKAISPSLMQPKRKEKLQRKPSRWRSVWAIAPTALVML